MRACRASVPKIYLPAPTWSNHHQIFGSLGFPCESFQYYDPQSGDVDIDSYYAMLRGAEPNSVVILHACAHNPTGCDPSKKQWREISHLMKERRLFPLFDAAYLGFNSGSLEEDAYAIRLFTGEMEMEVGICVSFAKNMGLYGRARSFLLVDMDPLTQSVGERTGCFLVTTRTEETATNTQSMLEMLQRSEVSNPPGFGAKIASQILGSDELRQMWYADMVTMSGRIRSMRKTLHEHLVSFGAFALAYHPHSILTRPGAPGSWDHLIRQSGMFGFLGLSPDVVVKLRGVSNRPLHGMNANR